MYKLTDETQCLWWHQFGHPGKAGHPADFRLLEIMEIDEYVNDNIRPYLPVVKLSNDHDCCLWIQVQECGNFVKVTDFGSCEIHPAGSKVGFWDSAKYFPKPWPGFSGNFLKTH